MSDDKPHVDRDSFVIGFAEGQRKAREEAARKSVCPECGHVVKAHIEGSCRYVYNGDAREQCECSWMPPRTLQGAADRMKWRYGKHPIVALEHRPGVVSCGAVNDGLTCGRGVHRFHGSWRHHPKRNAAKWKTTRHRLGTG